MHPHVVLLHVYVFHHLVSELLHTRRHSDSGGSGNLALLALFIPSWACWIST